MAQKLIPIIAVLPEGLESLGAKELAALGATHIDLLKRAVACKADMACLYRLYLQARLPFRLLREIARFPCRGRTSLYRGVQDAFDWSNWLHPSKSFRVDVSGSTQALNHSHFTALEVKNALVDFQKSVWGKRSSIDLKSPDLSLHLHLRNQVGVLSLDGTIEGLHRRGYRAAMGIAPLKENLAAGLIGLSGWDKSVPLVDPLCGSGTLLLEAAGIALGMPPGMNRSFLLEKWLDFDLNLWSNEKTQARHLQVIPNNFPMILGCEKDKNVAAQAKANVVAAGLDHVISIETCSFLELDFPSQPGTIICNPPYGKRIGNNLDLAKLYGDLGSYLKQVASGWQLWVLSGNSQLTKHLGMKSKCRIPINNGGIDCRFLHYSIR